MCGIFGEFTPGRQHTDLNILQKLNDLNFLRGPDSGGAWHQTPSLYLGFRRLAILDLRSEANQPMMSHDEQWVMVFNGEVYNHRDIRKKLGDAFVFRTHSDTETILCAFQHWGIPKTLELLDGMFAIGLFHIPSEKLYLIRDFAGIKPLWYGWNGQRLVFGSQYDQIRRHPDFCQQPVNTDILGLYLRYSYIPAPFGLHHQTAQLRPGEMLTLSASEGLKKELYWTFPAYHPEMLNGEEAENHFDLVLERGVTRELESDVPLGAFLSGGIDSPLITWYASKHTSGKLKAFSIGSDSQLHDESKDAQYYAEIIEVEHHLDRMNSASALSILDEVMFACREPLADFSIIPTFLVCRHARKQVTVALSGDGGDELFYGYERFWAVQKNRKYRNVPNSLKYGVYAADKLLFKNRHVNGNFLFSDAASAHAALHEHTRAARLDLLAPEAYLADLPETWDVYRYPNENQEDAELFQMARAEYYGMMQKTLAKVDRVSMANSLEVRVPFLLKEVMKEAWKIHPMLSYGPNQRKQLLKNLLTTKVGRPPISDAKRGFSVPLSDWLRKDLKKTVMEKTLDDDFLTQYGFDKKHLTEIWKLHLDKKADMKWALFTLYSLAEWDTHHNKLIT